MTDEKLEPFRRYAHRHRLLNTPLNDARWDDAATALAASDGQTVLDMGCGTGEMALRLATTTSVAVTGVDPDGLALDEARHRAANRDLIGSVAWVQEKREGFEATEPGTFDRLICVGAEHAFGSFEAMLEGCERLLSPGGRALVGAMYWRQDPSSEYATMLGESGPWTRFEGKVEEVMAKGWVPLWASEASMDEWDHFEWTAIRVTEDFVEANPDDAPARAALERKRSWRDDFLKAGRGVLGFGYLVIRRA